jgi:hypothetical protein
MVGGGGRLETVLSVIVNLLLCAGGTALYSVVIYEPMIYTAPYVMLLMQANPIQVGGGLGPGNRDFFGPCEMALNRQPSAIGGPKKSRQPYAKVDYIPPVRD